MNFYTKWLLVVCLNALFGFMAVDTSDLLLIFGKILGILSWYIIYVSLAAYLVKSGHEAASNRLFLSAIIRIPTQLLLYPDLFAGALALNTIGRVGMRLGNADFLVVYSATFLTGLFLSIFCSGIYLFLTVIYYWRGKNTAEAKAAL